MNDQQQINLMNHFDLFLSLCWSLFFFFFWEILFLTASLGVISWIMLLPLRISALRGCKPSRESCFWLKCRLCKSWKWFSFSWGSTAQTAASPLSLLKCSAVATWHSFVLYLHSFFHSPFTQTLSVRGQHSTTPGYFTPYSNQMLLDLSYYLTLGNQFKWYISAS